MSTEETVLLNPVINVEKLISIDKCLVIIEIRSFDQMKLDPYKLFPTSFWALFLSIGLSRISGRSGGSNPQTSGWVFSWFLKQAKQSFYVVFKRKLPKGKKISCASRQNNLCQNRRLKKKMSCLLFCCCSLFFPLPIFLLENAKGFNWILKRGVLMSLEKTLFIKNDFSIWRFSTEHTRHFLVDPTNHSEANTCNTALK